MCGAFALGVLWVAHTRRYPPYHSELATMHNALANTEWERFVSGGAPRLYVSGPCLLPRVCAVVRACVCMRAGYRRMLCVRA